MQNWIGYRWLAAHYDLVTVNPLRISSQLASRRSSQTQDGLTLESFPPAYQPENTPLGHLGFALRWEGIHLELLSRLFAVLPETELLTWITAEPTGQYARRACFLYEWLIGKTLAHPDVRTGNYIDVLNPAHYLVSQFPKNVRRWRVRDNLPGTRFFCPMVWRSEAVEAVTQFDCAAALGRLEHEFGTELMLHSSVWLSQKESKASFALEHEQDKADRIKRFAAVMATRCGQYSPPLHPDTLTKLQREILGEQALRYGIRRSPVFVGEVLHYRELIHYIAPHWDNILLMLDGLGEFERLTQGSSSIARAAVLAFGFVYIHPMPDGNGRISRFLINDILRRDGATSAPVILPVSATIASRRSTRQSYDAILERFSRPLLAHYANAYSFGQTQLYEDGVRSNFHFTAYTDALPAWSYPDLTEHVVWLGAMIRQTIEVELRDEAVLLRQHHLARQRIKDEALDGPNQDIDVIIRCILQNARTVSNKLQKTYPSVSAAVWNDIVEIINVCFPEPSYSPTTNRSP